MPAVEEIDHDDIDWLRQRELNWLVDPHLCGIALTYVDGVWSAKVTIRTVGKPGRRFVSIARAFSRVKALRKAYQEASNKLDESLAVTP